MGDSGRTGGPGQPVPDDENNGDGAAEARGWALTVFGVFLTAILAISLVYAYVYWR